MYRLPCLFRTSIRTVLGAVTFLCVFILFLSGCGDIEDSVVTKFKETVKYRLKDPDSASFTELTATLVEFPNVRPITGTGKGYFVQAIVRATNSFGGVVPEAFLGFFTESGEVLFIGSLELWFKNKSIEELEVFAKWHKQMIP